MPEAEAEERVILLSSISDLVKAADAFLKPVLHKAEPGKQTFCVIDGLTRYEYVLSTGGKEWGSTAESAGSE